MPADILTGPRLHLPDVTLVAVTSVAIEPTAAAISRSLAQVKFGAVLWLSDQPPPPSIAEAVQWCEIMRLGSRSDYSRFMLHDLHEHVATSHVLCIQWDGFVLDAVAWSPTFLDYDYIGAPWPQFDDGHIVGNGGFSLRSRKLLQSCVHLVRSSDEAEDIAICRTWRGVLEHDAGIRFAPPLLASRFAYERGAPTCGGTFGFHGVFNLVDLIAPAEFRRLLSMLELGLLARREHRELLHWALRRRQWRVAGQVLMRTISRWLPAA